MRVRCSMRLGIESMCQRVCCKKVLRVGAICVNEGITRIC